MKTSDSAYVLSTAKKGHVTQCLAVAELLGMDITEVIQERGINKAWPVWRRELDKINWFFLALRMAWKFRSAKTVIISSGRSVLPATRLIKVLRGERCLVLHIGSPKHWKSRCADIVLRPEHEREPDEGDGSLYPWNPTEVWVSAPIIRPLPTADTDKGEVTVLLGGLNITYVDDVASYSSLLDGLDQLVRSETVNIVFSRRTKPEVEKEVRQRFAQTSARLIEADDQGGFLESCKNAGAFLVTPDSITMVVEAWATGKPVYLPELSVKRSDTRNYRFIATALESGQARPFEGTIDFTRTPVERTDVQKAIAKIRSEIDAWYKSPSAATA